MKDRKQDIVEAGLAVLREHGYTGFTQPRVAARAGLRQSHLTYYHPTRVDLLAAVGGAAVERQLAAVDATLASLSSPKDAARAMADLVTRHENTRVFLALAQAGDEEPRLRGHFRDLAAGIVSRAQTFLSRVSGTPVSEERARFLHTLLVGLAVVDLATGRPDGRQRAAGVIETALQIMAGGSSAGKRPLPKPSKRGGKS